MAANLLDTLDLVGAVPAECAGPAGVVQQMQSVSKQMAQFSSNFYVIVMQEGIKSFQREDPTGKFGSLFYFNFIMTTTSLTFLSPVIAVAIQLTEILSASGMSLEDLLVEMDVSISCLCEWGFSIILNIDLLLNRRKSHKKDNRLRQSSQDTTHLLYD